MIDRRCLQILFYGQMHADDVIEMPGGTGYNVFAGLREKMLVDFGQSASLLHDSSYAVI